MGIGRQHALACLVAFYFCAINAALGWLVYHRDIHMLGRARALREPPALQTLLGLATPAPCRLQADLAIAVVPEPTHRPEEEPKKKPNDQNEHARGQNDLGPAKPLRLLQQLRRSTPHLRVAVLLLVTVDAFEPAHRQWCSAAPLCRLVLLEDATAPALLRAVRAQALCTPHVLLLSDALAVDSSFSARLRLLPAGRVACLLGGKHASASTGSTPGFATNAPPNTQACPRLAFNLPANFTIPADAAPEMPAAASAASAAIAHAAVRQARYAGAFPVVALA